MILKKKRVKQIVNGAVFVEDVDKFDAPFFNISRIEAESMDPQQRIVLELAWKCIEDAGYPPSRLAGSNTGVYVGVCNFDHKELLNKYVRDIPGHFLSGIANTMIPNRVSYYYNFHGPSVAVDTACSSSLVAINDAIKSIRQSECDMALAGGINLVCSGKHYIGFSNLSMLSPHGRCKAFDAEADGYVRGEGAGVILVKKLKAAWEDGDNIVAVLKGSAVNHGGAARTLTSPNSFSQSRVLKKAHEDADVLPNTIAFIEAHGTGTPLGDPLEIYGLKRCFSPYVKKSSEAICGVSTAKTNIGHLEGAAGIAGVIKVLLSLRAQTLAPLQNFETLNPKIKLENTPFYLVTKAQAWTRLKDSEGRELPRRAGVSSFGFGGTNAHIVIEEYLDEGSGFRVQGSGFRVQGVGRNDPYLIVLSAKNGDRLNEVVKNLHSYLKNQIINHKSEFINLNDLAYTLQVGREAMDERLAIVVESLEELADKLAEFLAGNEEIESLCRGHVNVGKDLMDLLARGRAWKGFIEATIEEGEWGQLAQLWVMGLKMNWDSMYSGSKPRRIPLPTYPFARERYWLPRSEGEGWKNREKNIPASQLHPLVNLNCSTLEEIRFKTFLSGDLFYLRDHRVMERKLLPGAAYLEMARAAGTLASDREITKLKNIVWLCPICINDSNQESCISLQAQKDHISFEVNTLSEGEQGERRVHNQGELEWGTYSAQVNERLDIKAIRSRCDRRFEGPDCYEAFARQGLHYGPTFQTIKNLFCNEHEVLSELELPVSAREDADALVLHPSVVDGALQSLMGFVDGCLDPQCVDRRPLVPFALKELLIYDPLPKATYSYVTRSKRAVSGDETLLCDIAITDRNGQVKARLKQLAARPLIPEPTVFVAKTDPTRKSCFFIESQWQKQPLPALSESQGQVLSRLVILVDCSREVNQALLEEELNQTEVIILSSQEKALYEGMMACFSGLLERIKSRLEESPLEKQQVVILIPSTEKFYRYAPLAGFIKTLQAEHANIMGKLIYYPSDWKEQTERLMQVLNLESRSSTFQGAEIRYADEERWISRFVELHDSDVSISSPSQAGALSSSSELLKADALRIKNKGVYWITGGMGKLGLIFAQHLGRGQTISLILSGRSAPDKEKLEELKRAVGKGVAVDYLQCDVSNKDEVETTFQLIKNKYGAIHGLIHGAGMIHDARISKKTSEVVNMTLGAKVGGAIYLDQATRTEQLDFFIFFSSVAGALGNPGQCDYAGANAFLDAFALDRHERVLKGKRWGKTLSIGWPLWESGGMGVNAATRKNIRTTIGLAPLSTSEGLAIFDRALSLPFSHLLVMSGDRDTLRRKVLRPQKVEHEAPTLSSKVHINGNVLLEQIEDTLTDMIAELLKVKKEDIDPDSDLKEYGFDSIALTQLSNRLNDQFDLETTPALFFEYSTVKSFVDYLLTTCSDRIASHYDMIPADSVGPSDGTNKASRQSSDFFDEEIETFSWMVEPLSHKADMEIPEVESFMAKLMNAGIALWTEGNHLKARAVKQVLTPELRQRIAKMSINLVNYMGERRYLPLSSSQKRYWMLSLSQSDRAAYNNPVGFQLIGKLDDSLLKTALLGLVRRYSLLRAIFPQIERTPVQVIQPQHAELRLPINDLSEISDVQRIEEQVHKLSIEESSLPIDPRVGPNFRMRLIKRSDTNHLLLLTVHHTLFDGFSFAPFIEHLIETYEALRAGKEESTKLPLEYSDYILLESIAPEPEQASEDFWRETLKEAPPCTELPLDFPRPEVSSFRGDAEKIQLPCAVLQGFKKLLNTQESSLFVGLLAVLKLVIYRWTSQADLVVGTVIQTRDRREWEQMLGDFTNFLPIRSRLDGTQTFIEFLRELQTNLGQALAHKKYPVGKMAAFPRRGPANMNPLYNIHVTQLPVQEPLKMNDDLEGTLFNHRSLTQSAMMDLRFEWYEIPAQGLELVCEYNVEIFTISTIRSFLDAYRETVKQILRSPHDRLDQFVIGLHAVQSKAEFVSVNGRAKVEEDPGAKSGANDWEAMVSRLTLLYAELLDRDPSSIDTDTNFFEMGGNSMAAVQLKIELEKEFSTIKTTEIFLHPTIRSMAGYLCPGSKTKKPKKEFPARVQAHERTQTSSLSVKPAAGQTRKSSNGSARRAGLLHLSRRRNQRCTS